MPRTFLAIMQFDGTRFLGWQRQPTGRTVQTELEAVLERLAGHPVRVHAAGRTDAGVHALGMGASFTLPDRWTPVALRRALNGLLPRDCFVTEVRETQSEFHARKHAIERRYRYQVGTDDLCHSPFRRPFEWPLGMTLDLEQLAQAATLIVGRFDFRAFSVKSSVRPHTMCEVRRAEWTLRDDGSGLTFDIHGDRFLHHMVRFLVGTMVDVALERRPGEDLRRLLERRPEVRTSRPAPAQGLYFMAAVYPERWFALS